MNEKINPIIPREIVAPTMKIKFFEVSNLIIAKNVDSGDGSINSEWYSTDTIFQQRSRKIIDSIVIILFFEIVRFIDFIYSINQ